MLPRACFVLTAVIFAQIAQEKEKEVALMKSNIAKDRDDRQGSMSRVKLSVAMFHRIMD